MSTKGELTLKICEEGADHNYHNWKPLNELFSSVGVTVLGIALVTKNREKELLLRRQGLSLANVHNLKYTIATGCSVTSSVC